MITAEQKPLEEIIAYVEPYSRILLVGCNECVTVCAAGGRKEVGLLASALRMDNQQKGKTVDIKEITLERQCDPEYVEELVQEVKEADAILSMACGCGVQDRCCTLQCSGIPGCEHKVHGRIQIPRCLEERCQGCGDCMLGITGGICPVARCSKSLLNGPLRRNLQWPM